LNDNRILLISMDNVHHLDIWHIIFQRYDLFSQLGLIVTCSDFYQSFHIDILTKSIAYKLTNSVLKQKKFSRITKLNILSNNAINDI